MFVATTIVRFALMKVLLKPLANAAVGTTPAGAKDRKKFVEAAWRAIVYAAACCYALKCTVLGTAEMPWLEDSVHFWMGWPHDVSDDMLSLYAMYVGFYVHMLVFLFLDVKSSDFYALIIHHCVTLFITLCSWMVMMTRVGSFVMVLHDFSDVFLEVAKCFNYSQRQHKWCSSGADVTFVIFAASFFYLRLYIYPTRVLSSAVYGACEYAGCVIPPTLGNCFRQPAYLAFIPALSILQVLQIFWGWKVLGVIATVLRGKPLEDPRDD